VVLPLQVMSTINQSPRVDNPWFIHDSQAATVQFLEVGNMHLAMRFHITREFVDFPLTNWLDNSAWYDMKILVDAYNLQRSFSKPISNNTYCKAIKKVLQELRLPSTHFVHLGRKLGSKELEMLETQGSQIDALGNWNSNNVRETRYSTKLPMEAIKNKAGFTTGEKTHYLVRQGIDVLEVLLLKTPLHSAMKPNHT
jgi:Centromere DNA-binding protein complex CBF3 subunit, domain 2